MTEKLVYMFDDPRPEKTPKEMKLTYGGKGAGLARMTQMGLPVPYGFTIPCKLSTSAKEGWPEGLKQQVNESVAKLEERSGKKFGDPDNPLLLSVRSGAPDSMPGMMDTVLNLGMNARIAEEMAKKNARFAWDSWRRFIMSFSDTVMGTGREPYDQLMDAMKAEKGTDEDLGLTADDLKALSIKFLAKYKELVKKDFPEDPYKQLYAAVDAVFKSWDGERAVAYRKMNKIPDYGTAVNVQQMVFGNLNDNSGTGVLFTRSPVDGERRLTGEFLENAQGEDVVAGVRTPTAIEDLKVTKPDLYNQIHDLAKMLENNYKDMQDCELTVEDGRLYFLQTRNGKRTAASAIKIAMDLLREEMIDEKTAVTRLEPSKVDELLNKRISPKETKRPITKGYNASPGAVTGEAVFSKEKAIEARKAGKKVVLVRKETKPEDFPGMIASIGILTSRGGKTCHAAVVARGIGLPAIVGAGDLVIDEDEGTCACGEEVVLKEGDIVSIDGMTGNVFIGPVEVVEPEIAGDFAEYLKLCDKYRTMGVRANADTPKMAQDAVKNGAEGIGLCRTERMFNAAGRLPKVLDMIKANTLQEREAALSALKPLQKGDFVDIFKAMDGKPVTIRLLDPPLHEFLPSYKDMLIEFTELRVKGETKSNRFAELEMWIKKYEELREENAMLGHRGVRLGNTNPEIYKMQVAALMEALVETEKNGVDVRLEIMLPLVSHVNEYKRLYEMLKPEADKVLGGYVPKNKVLWGTMIELPRAALTSGEIAEEAEFFSFGTNDLTQATFGFSRDDVEGKFLLKYLDEFKPPIMEDNPFEHIDELGVGRLIKISAEEGRKAREAKGGYLKVGICGEVGGDPQSIMFLQKCGLDYVSCSPFRIIAARVAAAHAAIATGAEKGK
ncbi:MAG: pyruvate, phosphate dikinase [Candidatus Lokiarchaeota archaeon]|nr:pyruvate, phosphate dikinase [Candidatus Lokiarchaeota archaeon]